MKTKRFLLATSGATVDGRTIDARMLEEMAKSYDPKTYAARLNIEHIRGISGDGPFRAYGDVLSLETEKVTVDFNGEQEERTGLYGVFDVTDDAKALNTAGQKLYPSIEIQPDFAGKGFAYLMGCALTDSPASIGTERMEFNRHLPGALRLHSDKPEDAALLQFAEQAADEENDQPGAGFIASFGKMLDNVFNKGGAAAPGTKDDDAGKEKPGAPEGFSADTLRPLFEEMGKTFSAEIRRVESRFNSEIDQLGVSLKSVSDKFEATPGTEHVKRPAAAGANGNQFKTDF